MYLSERYLYGSDRLGVEQVDKIIASSTPTLINTTYEQEKYVGDKRYEMKNHLSNVLSLVTDRKLPEDDGQRNVDYYTADVVSYSDYFPFGMLMKSRHGNSRDYRYGFQGQEKDDEVKGEGNSYTTHFREFDPRLARWLSLDPRSSKYPGFSPYNAFINNPNIFIDSRGDTIKWANNMATDMLRSKINDMRKSSSVFDVLIISLENSPHLINVDVNGDKLTKERSNTTQGRYRYNFTTGAREVLLRENAEETTITEEFFHAYQFIKYSKVDIPKSHDDISRTEAQLESEANLAQVIVNGQLKLPIYLQPGAFADLVEESFFDALRKNQYLITEGTEVSKKYFDYLDLTEILQEGNGIYSGKQPHVLPDAVNNLTSKSIITDIKVPEYGVIITGKKDGND